MGITPESTPQATCSSNWPARHIPARVCQPTHAPQIGVVVATLNSAATLEWTLCALRSQRDVCADIIVADSGSQDGTLDICRRCDVRTIYVPPGNIYRAINAGLGETTSEWVALLNSDDLVYPSSYARLIALGERQGASLVYGDCDFIDAEGRFLFTLKSPPPARIGGLLQHGDYGFVYAAAIWRRSIFQELRGFDESYRLISDYDFFFRLVSSRYSLAKLDGPTVAAFRRHREELSRREADAMARESQTFRDSGKVRRSLGSYADWMAWHLENSPNHLWRLRSKRTWHRFLLKMLGEFPC